MARAVYVWRGGQGAGLYESSAQEIGETLAEIEAEHGALTPKDVVSAAKSELNPLHRHFEWHDGKAAQRWRLHQARQLIASVYVTAIDARVAPEPVRAFVNLRPIDHEDQKYENIASVLSNEKKRIILLRQATIELRSWERRYRELNEFATVFAAIQEVADVVTA